jgi:alkylhydroperoxidase family enzyme
MRSIDGIRTGSFTFDIDAREAQVTSTEQRIAPLAFDEISSEGKQLLKDVAMSLGAGVRDARQTQIDGISQELNDRQPSQFQIPPTVATMMRHPSVYRLQMELSAQLLSGAISSRERELALLRLAWLCRVPYMWGEHVEVGKLSGLGAEDIERVTRGSSAEGWSDHERALLRAVEELLDDQSISDEIWQALARSWNEIQLMELPVLVGAYYTMALQQNSFKVRLPEHNRGLHQR